MRKLLKKVTQYYRSHLRFSLTSVILCMAMLIFIILQVYMKREYIAYLEDKTIEAETTIMKSVKANIDFAVSDLIQIGTSTAIDTSLYEVVKEIEEKGKSPELELKIEDILNRYANQSQWIIGMCVSKQGVPMYQYDKMQKAIKIWDRYDPVLSDCYDKMQQLVEDNEVPKMVVALEPWEYPLSSVKSVLHINFPLLHIGMKEDQHIMLTLTINTSILEPFLNQIYESYEDVATGYIVNQENEVVYHQEANRIGEKRVQDLSVQDITNIQIPIGKLDWVLNIDIDKKQLLTKVNQIYYSASIIFMLVVVVVLFIYYCIVQNKIFVPLQVILRAIQQAKKGKTHEPIAVRGEDEIWQVAEQFNYMMEALQESKAQREQEYQEKVLAFKKQRQAERKALESQINAHFICNTINVINYEAIDAGNHKVSILLKKLSNILRYTFEQSNQKVYLYQEIAWIEQYLYLQKTRFEDVFEYEVLVDEALQSRSFGKLMLQPFVENSIIHGFEGIRKGGKIRILGEELQDKSLKIMIEDNGRGMTAEVAHKIQSAIKNPYQKNIQGIGISNAAARIYAYFGEEAQLELETEEGRGCKFTFILPVREGE